LEDNNQPINTLMPCLPP